MATKSIAAERLDKKSHALPIGWEEMSQALLRNAGLGIYIVQEGKFQYVNPLFQNLIGFTEKELLGKYCLDFVQPEDREMVRKKAIENLKSKKGPIPYEYGFMKKNGEIIWALEEVTSIDYEGKQATLGTFIDITDRKRLQEAVSYSEKRYRTMLESMEDSYFEVDLAGNFTFVNNSVCRDLGYSIEELIGMNYKDYTAEENIESLFQAFNEVYRTGMPNKGFPWKTTRKDGSHGFVETSISPLRNSKSEIVGFCGVGRDVTERKQTEEKLQQSEENYKTLFDGSAIGMYVMDAETMTVVMGNRASREMVGLKSEQEGIGINPFDFVVPEDREKVLEIAINEFLQDSHQTHEVQVIDKNNQRRWHSFSIARIIHQGRLASLVSIMDITERKQAEEALRQSEEKYRTVLDEIGDAYFEVDLKGTFTFVNDQMSQLLQYSKEELLGMNYKTFTPEEDIKNVYENYNEVYRTGQPILGYGHRVIRKDGTSGFHDVSISTLKNEKGEIIGFRGISRDISERKRLEETIAYSEKRYRTILDEIHDAYFEVDLNGTFTFVNDQMTQHLQYSREELLRMSYKNFTPEEELKNVYQAYNRAYRTGEPSLSFGQRTIRKDGTKGFSDVSISPLKNAKGEITGFRGISRDITARKRLEEEREALLQEIRKINLKLEEANKELQDFVYIASHDLREPLRKISSFGTLLQDSLKGKLNEDQQENFEFMIDGARRMQDMIDALLTYSRLTTKAKPFEWVDLNKVIEDLKKLELATMLDETRGSIHVPEPLPSIQADPSQMHQLFQNLIGNGLKFHKEGIPPEITIRAHEIDIDMIRIEVEDNGVGIDEKYHGQLFTMFKRLHSREEYEGTGIGLASCKKIIERHGGNIGIKSTSGKGSTFWFTLPREKYLKKD